MRSSFAALAWAVLAAHDFAVAQPRPGQISARVLDPSSVAVAGVVVELSSATGTQRAVTNVAGDVRFNGLGPGDYKLSVTVEGFDSYSRGTTIAPGQQISIAIRLRLASVRQRITVEDSAERLSIESDANRNTVTVGGETLQNLPVLDLNFVAALQRFLDPGTPGGSGVSLIVDGMEARNVGVTASAIQEIRINNNPYTAEFPRWSRRRLEVITKPSADAFHGTLNWLFRDYRLNARDALAAQRPREQKRIYEGSLFGPVGRSKKMSFLLTSAREEEDLQSVVVAQTAQGAIRENVPAPAINTYVSARLTWQPNDRQSMFFQENFQDRWQNNVGVGGTALAEAGTQNRFREDEFIFNHRFVFTPKLLSQFRILVGRYWAPTRSNREAVRVVVSDAFTGGGAQADRLSTEFHAAITWMLTQTAGRHTLKYGINVPDWSRRGLSDRSNQLGSFSYASLADYASGNPFAAVVQRGDPRTVFVEKNVGGFLQDEWQIRRNLQLSMGARYDWQNYFGDTNNFAPRLAIAWSPERANKLVLRVGAGTFFDRSGPGPVWDILRFNGVQLRRYVLGGPDLSAFLATGAILAPTSVHRLASNVALPNVAQFSASAEYQLAKKTTLALGYVGFRGVEQFRSRDANAPLPPQFGARPERSVNALREIESAGRVQGDSFEVTLRGALGPKATGTAQYVFARTLTNTGGVNWYPANSFDPRGEWGRADTDRRHQFNLLGTAALHRWVNLGFSISLLTGVPYNITTGRDDNGDGMAIDRPVGVTRNTGLGPGYATVDLRWFREFRFRPALKDKSPSMTVSLDALNLLNKINPVNYVGALSSPFFGQAVATQPARRVQIGARLQF